MSTQRKSLRSRALKTALIYTYAAILGAALGSVLASTASGCQSARSVARVALPAAQAALDGVHFVVAGEAAVSGGIGFGYLAVEPAAGAELQLWLPIVGKVWSLNTERHPGPWYYRIDFGGDPEADEWIALMPITRAEAAQRLPGFAALDGGQAQKSAGVVTPAPAMAPVTVPR